MVLNTIIKELSTYSLEYLVVVANNNIGLGDSIIYKKRPKDFEDLKKALLLFAAQQIVGNIKGRL